MVSRRDFIQLAAATAALAPGGWSRAFAQQQLTQADLLRFEPVGNVTLVHLADLHAQLLPVLFREPSNNLGVGEALVVQVVEEGPHALREDRVGA